MKLSKFSLAFGAYIIISASFMQQVWVAWKAFLGIKTLVFLFCLLCIWTVFATLYNNTKTGFNIKKVSLICAVYLFGFLFAWRQPYAPEKVHVLEYGVLAWLASRDLSKAEKITLRGMLCAFLFILLISFLDEGFQKLLPWRVFEIRDIATNLISGLIGIAIFCLTAR